MSRRLSGECLFRHVLTISGSWQPAQLTSAVCDREVVIFKSRAVGPSVVDWTTVHADVLADLRTAASEACLKPGLGTALVTRKQLQWLEGVLGVKAKGVNGKAK